MPAATVIVPSGFMVMEPAIGVGAVPGVKLMAEGTTVAPFSVSLPRTEGVLPPDILLTEGGLSVAAAIGAGSTVTVAVVVEQFVGFSFSQMV